MPEEKDQKENYQNTNNGWIRIEDYGDLFSLVSYFPKFGRVVMLFLKQTQFYSL